MQQVMCMTCHAVGDAAGRVHDMLRSGDSWGAHPNQ